MITLQMPLRNRRAGLIGRRELELMKPDAVLVNTSRGGVVDEQALVEALHQGRLGGAALDVIAEEPPPRDAPILSAPRTLLSPHVAWLSQAAEARLRDHTLRAVVDYLAGRPLVVGELAQAL